MIQLAVIDSMVDIESEVIDKNRMSFYGDNKTFYKKLGHGNAVCGLLLNASSDYYLNLFVVQKSSTPSRIIEILEYILYQTHIKYICMSCGFLKLSEYDKRKLKEVCDELRKNERIVVVASSNEEFQKVYPAAFASVITVDSKFKKPNFYWKKCKKEKVTICWRKGLFIDDASNSFHVPLVMDYIIKHKLESKIIEGF